jgi:hypothetical protein
MTGYMGAISLPKYSTKVLANGTGPYMSPQTALGGWLDDWSPGSGDTILISRDGSSPVGRMLIAK